MHCYKVKTITTNGLGNFTYRPINDDGVKERMAVDNGEFYIVCESVSQIERIVDSDSILSIERVGIGHWVHITT